MDPNILGSPHMIDYSERLDVLDVFLFFTSLKGVEIAFWDGPLIATNFHQTLLISTILLPILLSYQTFPWQEYHGISSAHRTWEFMVNQWRDDVTWCHLIIFTLEFVVSYDAKPTVQRAAETYHFTEIMSLGSVSRLGTSECLDLHVQVWRASLQIRTKVLITSIAHIISSTLLYPLYLLLQIEFHIWYKTRNEVCILNRHIQHRSYVWGPSVSSGYSCFSPHSLAGLFFWTWSWPLVRANPSGS